MSPELRELFEIRQEEEKKNNLPINQDIWSHILIRLAVIILGTIVFSFIISQASGWGVFGYIFYMVIFHAAWLLFILIETIVLQSNEKYKLRNVNLIFIGILLLIYGLGFALIS